MPSDFDARVSAGLARLHAQTTQTATYQWDAQELEIAVTWGRDPLEEISTVGSGVIADMPDALIEDYAELLATRGVPQRGDRIVQNGITYMVLPHGDEHVYRWSGNARQVLRIHTKIIAEE